MANKTASHPDGKYIIRFQEHNHSYIDNFGSRYVSGTSFVKPFFPKFDAVAVAMKCAAGDNPKYAGRDPKEIQAEWLAEGKRGSSEGTNVHEYAECCFDQSDIPVKIKAISDRVSLLFNQVNRAYEILLSKGFKIIAREMMVFSPELGIAGTVDLIMWNPIKSEILILDWKQNKNAPTTENTFQSGFFPLDHLQDTEINKYSLQLSLYQYLIIRENYFPKAKGYKRALIHLTTDNAKLIKLDYYNYEIAEMIKHASRK